MPTSVYKIEEYIGRVEDFWVKGYYDSEATVAYAFENANIDLLKLFFLRATDFGYSQQQFITQAIVDECLNVMNEVTGGTVRGQEIAVSFDLRFRERYGKVAFICTLGGEGITGKYEFLSTARYAALAGNENVWSQIYSTVTEGGTYLDRVITKKDIADFFYSVHP
ncbi:hypothetical protein [Sodalis sp. RH19]|uniref:hypothetical protein n=1 Tax=Sodalis sp. RH19 TaxID=3394334 RepID=UPI0039B4D113